MFEINKNKVDEYDSSISSPIVDNEINNQDNPISH
jgi:hypothetical protein